MYYIGIDLGGTNIAVGIVLKDGTIIRKASIPTFRERSYQEIIKDMAMLTLKLLEEENVKIEDVNSVGIGCPGTPNEKEGVIVYSNNIKFKNVPLRNEFQKYLNLPVYIDNDANVAALAESVAGAAKGAEYSVTITIGTGIGSGVVVNKKVYSGFNNAAAEMGHMVIVVNGEQCTCGRKGCWEAYSSATACISQSKAAAINNPDSIINKLVNNDLNMIDAKTAFDAARQGDESGKSVINEYINYLAEGIANTINILQPELVVIGGGVCKEGEFLLKPLRELVAKRVYTSEGVPLTEIKVAKLGNDAGIVGAAMLGI